MCSSGFGSELSGHVVLHLPWEAKTQTVRLCMISLCVAGGRNSKWNQWQNQYVLNGFYPNHKSVSWRERGITQHLIRFLQHVPEEYLSVYWPPTGTHSRGSLKLQIPAPDLDQWNKTRGLKEAGIWIFEKFPWWSWQSAGPGHSVQVWKAQVFIDHISLNGTFHKRSKTLQPTHIQCHVLGTSRLNLGVVYGY